MELCSSFLNSLSSFSYIISTEVLFSLPHHHFLLSIHLISSSSSIFLFALISALLFCIFLYSPFSLSFYNTKEKMLDHFPRLRRDTPLCIYCEYIVFCIAADIFSSTHTPDVHLGRWNLSCLASLHPLLIIICQVTLCSLFHSKAQSLPATSSQFTCLSC